MNHPIVRATAADIPALADVLATCFRDDPMLTWPLFVDDDDIEPIRLMFVWLDTELAEEGWIWTTEDRSAVMALIPPDAHERMWELDRSTRPKIGALCPDGGARYTAFWERVVSRFPDEPHWFVDQLAVHPERQGEGIGSSFLRFALGRASADGLPLLLETGRARNVPYYEGFGLEVILDEDVPPGGPHVWFMRRNPGRRAARVIVVDRRQRVLLFGYRNPADGREVWATTGGGIEPGETPEDAARREFREETDHDAPKDLGPIVCRRVVTVEWDGRPHPQDEVFYLVRVDDLMVSDAHVETLASEGVIGHRWLTLEEIRDRDGFEVAPRNLADLVTDVIEHGPPPQPIDVGL